MVARALGLDPVEFRRSNVLKNGRPQATGTILEDAPLEAILDHVAERLHWKEKFDRGSGTIKRGRGIAFALKACVSPTTSVAIINVGADGSPTLYISTVDMGQGSDTEVADRRRGFERARGNRCGSSPAIPTSRPTTWARSARARCFTWATRCGSPREDARDKIDALAPRGRRAGRQQHRRCRTVHQEVRHAGRQYRRQRQLQARLLSRRITTPARRPRSRRSGWSRGTGAEVEVDTETGHVRDCEARQRGRLRHGRSIRASSRRRFPARR